MPAAQTLTCAQSLLLVFWLTIDLSGSHPRLCSRWLPVSRRLRRPLAERTTSPPPSVVVSAEVMLPAPLLPVRAGEALGLPERPAMQTLTRIALLDVGGQSNKQHGCPDGYDLYEKGTACSLQNELTACWLNSHSSLLWVSGAKHF